AENSSRAISRYLTQLQEPLPYMGMELSLSPVTGLAVFPDHGDDVSNLIRQAYIAQESSTTPGQDLSYYLAGQDLYNADRLTVAAELKRALEHDELELFYQPKLSLRDK